MSELQDDGEIDCLDRNLVGISERGRRKWNNNKFCPQQEEEESQRIWIFIIIIIEFNKLVNLTRS